MNPDRNAMVLAGCDGTIMMYKIDFENFLKTARTGI
jgi:hypothetical protein